MKQKRIKGNSLKCHSCRFFEEADKLPGSNDGYCTIGHLTINGKRFKKERVMRYSLDHACKEYIDFFDLATWDMIHGFEPMQEAMEVIE